MKTLLVVAACVFLGSLASAQSVHVVDQANGPGAEFTDLSSAMGAAAPGDILLVRQGLYPVRLVISEPLTILAESGANVRLRSVLVYQLPAGAEVVLRGLTLESKMDRDLGGQDCDGTIWVEDCTLLAEPNFFNGGGASFQNCANVVMTRCSIVSSKRRTAPDEVLSSYVSSLHLFDTTLVASAFDDFDGTPALYALQSSVTLSGCALTGGAGLDGSASQCLGGSGGPAALLQNRVALVAQDSLFTGGPGGLGTCGDGAPGESVKLDTQYPPSTLASSDTPARTLAASSPVRDDELLQTTFQGEAGDRVWLVYSLATGASRFPTVEGTLLLSPAHASLFMGSIAGSPLVRTFPVPDLGVGVEALRIFAQPLFMNHARGELVLGTPQALTVLDDAF